MINKDDPLDWYIEICIECGCQLGPGIGSRTDTGRCVVKSHHQRGGVVVRVKAKDLIEQNDKSAINILTRLGVT